MKAARLAIAIAAAGALTASVSALALRSSAPASRCGEGWVASPQGARCCPNGQLADNAGICHGPARACPPGYIGPREGACLPDDRRVAFAGGVVRVGPSDWEAQSVVTPRELRVGPFLLDRYEISVARLAACVASGPCAGPVPAGDPGRAAPLDASALDAFCRAAGGRMPSEDEWIFAAMGAGARRYPWGETGAVCTAAAFGLTRGPCAVGATGPDSVGAHPAGRSPEGVDDLAGNLAEWVRPAGGGWALRGGSFASSLATELRGWYRASQGAGRAAEAGGRCAYDPPASSFPAEGIPADDPRAVP